MSNLFRYAAFLRGINVGGKNVIKMVDLRSAFKKHGFENVKTILASGNVVFDSKTDDMSKLIEDVRNVLKDAFGKDISVVIRRLEELKTLHSLEPFKGIKITPTTRQYITFLGEENKQSNLVIPYTSPQGEFSILYRSTTEILSVIELSKGKGTLDLMAIVEKEFGSNLTTRNWNTITKVLL